MQARAGSPCLASALGAVPGSAYRRFPQFQGEWFVVGLAGSTHSKTDRFLLNPFIATFEQNGNSRLEVLYAMTR